MIIHTVNTQHKWCMQRSLARQTHRKRSRLTHIGKYFPQFNGPDKNLGSKRCIHSYLMLCIGLNVLLAQLQQKILTDIVMNVVPIQPVLCGEPFYCYHWDSLTPSCPTVSAPAVPGNLANTRTLQGYRAANPSLRNQPQSPESNYRCWHGSS